MKTEKQKFEGEYYTPLNFVREVHKRLAQLQPDYLEVPTWDPAAGAQHLTKEFDYSCLASSTLNDNEADVQYDYLNEEELPEAIKCVIEQGKEMKRFNFICNPPYAAAGNNKRDDESKAGVSFTKVRELIQKEKTHTCFARNLSTQFLWRTIKFYEDNPEIEEGYIVWIDKVDYLSSGTRTKLRERLFSLFDFVDGFMIDAGNFEGIKKGSWSIGFSIFKLNRNKEVYNLDDNKTNHSYYVRNPKIKLKIEYPQLSSPLKLTTTNKILGCENQLGYFVCDSNNIRESEQGVALMSSLYAKNKGLSVCISNYKKCIEFFTARRIIKNSSYNDKDEYMKPFSNKPNQIFKFDILENTEEGIVQIGEKEVYNLDGGEIVLLRSFLKGSVKSEEFQTRPVLSSSITIKNDTCTGVKSGLKNMIGDMYFDSSCVQMNATSVAFFTTSFSNSHNIQVTKSNFHKAIQGFCARRLISSNVWNEKDEYMKPSDTTLASDDYKQWSNDCIIYSLFDNQSFQSSLRQVEYQSKKWDIKNEFFWMSKGDIETLAKTHLNELVANDLANDEERYVYTEIERIKGETITFSKEALDLLNYMTKVVKETFPLRLNSDKAHHFNSWDAGYSQIKLYMTKEQKDEMKKLRDILANKLRPKVYYFGFLYDPKYKHWTDDLPFIAEIDGELYDFVNQEGRVLTRSEFKELTCEAENDAASCKE